MKIIKGVFLSDAHLPWNTKLGGVFEYLKVLKPDVVVLGGDIIDASGTHGIDGWTADQVEHKAIPLYERDVKLLRDFLLRVDKATPKSDVVFLEGNHEERYRRPKARYPGLCKGHFDLPVDAVPEAMKKHFKWIPYGDYESFWKLGDCLFTHGTVYPDIHSKKYAYAYLPSKVIYGHLHDFQAYTVHSGHPKVPGRYAVTTGALCERAPDYKEGAPNKWINGFTEFTCIDGVVLTSSHIMHDGVFAIGGKVYGAQ